MAKLFTKHDPFHVHKILGVLVLLHFFFRFASLCLTGDAFPESESTFRASAGVLLHGLLSWSSLLLPLPRKRNFSSPMIWPEFRLHSITFATRHVFCTIISLNKLWPTGILAGAALRLGIVYVTTVCASEITTRFGDREIRTTNAMPYPDSVTDLQRQSVKMRYAASQFAATAGALMCDPTVNFFPLLGIQLAPFLMTLVRKAKIGSFSYHRVYATALWLTYGVAAVRVSVGALEPRHTLFAAFAIPNYMRIKLRIPTWICWTWYVLVVYVIWPTLVRSTGLPATVRHLMFVPIAFDHLRAYLPLFGIQALAAGSMGMWEFVFAFPRSCLATLRGQQQHSSSLLLKAGSTKTLQKHSGFTSRSTPKVL